MDDIWKWCGFARKDPAKRLIEKIFIKDIDYKIVFHQNVENLKVKHFIENVDYKVALLQPQERKNEGGFNKEAEHKLVFLKSQENLKVSEEKAAPQVGGSASEQVLMTIKTFKSYAC